MTAAPYGSWRSPLSASTVAAGGRGLHAPMLDDDTLYWLESRPDEGGRNVIVRRAPGEADLDLFPAPWTARDRVHEYGGASYGVADGMVVFSNDADARLYRLDRDSSVPVALTPDPGDRKLRYAVMTFDLPRRRLLAIREDHRDGGEPVNTIVAVNLDQVGDEGVVLAGGHDFMGPVALNRSGARAAWLAWDHPNMPWDGSTLYVADVLEDGTFGPARIVAGGPTESIFQPIWASDDSLIFASDRTEWWNLYRWNNDAVTQVVDRAAEYAHPQWVFGMSAYAFVDATSLVAASNIGGIWGLSRINIETGEETPIRHSLHRF